MEARPKRRRARFNKQEIQQLLAAWHKSGMSAAAFAQQAGVNKSNLWRWTRSVGQDPERRVKAGRPGRGEARGSRFIEVRVDRDSKRSAAAATAPEHVPHFEIEGPFGMRVRVYPGADAETLGRLLAALPGGARC
jgi:transposase-like protein